MQKLTDTKIELLIELVKKHPGLYEKGDKCYRKNEWREKTWNVIPTELEASAKDCKNAWRSLRDQFPSSLKERKGSTGQAAPESCNKKKYKYFENLLFLQESLQPRRTTCNFQAAEQEDINDISTTDEDNTLFWTQIDGEDLTVESEHATFSEGSRHFLFNAPRQQSSSSVSRTSTPIQAKKRRMEENTEQAFGDFLKDLLQQVSEKSKDDIDGVDNFFLGLSHTVKSQELTPFQLINLQCKITLLISQEINKCKVQNP